MKKCTVGYNKNCVVIKSDDVTLAVATDKGPRVVGCFIGKGSKQNMFAELPAVPMRQSNNGYCLYGGHRLWHSPEACPLCYEPDNDPVTVIETENGVEFIGAVAPSTGIKKSILIEPLGDGMFAVTHTLEHCGIWPVEIAPWALTMMAPGGMMILPQNFKEDGYPYAPDRNLVLWPYTNLADKRFNFGERYILVKNDPKNKKALKIGFNDQAGWIGYANFGNAFLKYIEVEPDGKYPDNGCTVESYTCDVHTEIETLGPLAKVEPGDVIQHVEFWQGLAGIGEIKNEKDVIKLIEPELISFEHDDCCCGDEDCHCEDQGEKRK